MSRGLAVPARLSHLAAGQWGLLTTAQAEQGGITRLQLTRLTEAGVLERVAHGVYVMTAAADDRLTLRAAWLALFPAMTAEQRLRDPSSTGVVSYASAAGLHGLGELTDDVPEFTIDGRKQSRRSVRIHRGVLLPAEITIVGGLPTTTIERTIADLIRDGQDLEHVAGIVGQAATRNRLDRQALSAQLEAIAPRHGYSDGSDFAEALLDLVGLSSEGMLRDLASTPIGMELLALGAASVLQSSAPSGSATALAGASSTRAIGQNLQFSESIAAFQRLQQVRDASTRQDESELGHGPQAGDG